MTIREAAPYIMILLACLASLIAAAFFCSAPLVLVLYIFGAIAATFATVNRFTPAAPGPYGYD